MNSSISIIIPAYNAEPTLGETLDSIAAQTMNPDEVFVIDDGSQDGTAALADQHPVSPRVIRVANAGAPAAMNTGIEAARGDYLCFLDADDLWTPEKLERQRAMLRQRPEIGFVLGFTEAFECPSMPPEAFRKINYVRGPAPGYFSGTIMARRELFSEIPGLYDASLRTGYFIDWFHRARSAGVPFEMIETILHRRRIRPNTLSRRVAESGGNGPDALSRDFLEIARRAILDKRKRGQ